MSETFVFNGVTGIEYEIRKVTGEQINDLTKQGSQSETDKMNNFMLLSTVRIGSKMDVTKDDIQNMLSKDTYKLLMQSVFFNNPKKKHFNYKYELQHPTMKMKQMFSEPFNFSDEAIFDEKPYMDFDKHGNLVPVYYTELSDIKKTRSLVLEDKKDEKGNPAVVQFSLVDGNLEKGMQRIKPEKDGIEAKCKLHCLKEWITIPDAKKGETKVLANLSSTSLTVNDQSLVFDAILDTEGRYNTLFDIDNPYEERYEKIRVNLIGMQGFILPRI